MKKREVDVREHFSKYSEDYHANVHGLLKDTYRNVGETLDKQLYGTILDIGNGGVFFYNTDALKKIIAVDLAYPKEIRNDEKISFYSGDARDLDFLETGKFDCVLMQFLLHHVVEKTQNKMDESLAKVLAETYRLLKPKGKLIIVEPVVFRTLELYENLFYRVNSYILKLFNRPMVKFYSKRSLRLHVERAGYCDLRLEKISLGKKWIPLAPAIFPDKFVVPPCLFPTRFYCIVASKGSSP